MPISRVFPKFHLCTYKIIYRKRTGIFQLQLVQKRVTKSVIFSFSANFLAMGDTEKALMTVKRNDKVGRYATASRDLKGGDVIFTEKPFAFGPKPDSPPMCLGCYGAVDCTVFCSKCGWPVCGPDCEAIPAHRDAECSVFASASVKFQPVEDIEAICLQYECITPLRVLLAKEKNPNRWQEEIEPMQSHNENRKIKPIWEFNQTNIVEYLRGPCKLDRFSEELIHTVCGILDVNAFESRTIGGYLIRCLYPKLAILSHNCVSNIAHSIDITGSGDQTDFIVTVRAAVNVKKDEELFSSYTYSLYPTLVRREFLKESKYFECACKRCSDKTELGTHLSSLKCNKCDNGIIMSTEPLDPEAGWHCTHCEFKTGGSAVRKVFATIQAEVEAVDMNAEAEALEARETIFRKYRSVLHPNNAYMTILRSALSQLYGKSEGYSMEDLPDIVLERKVELCYDLLYVIDIIEPGYTRIRGLTLYELHAPLMILAKNQYTAGTIERPEFRKKLEDSIQLLEKSVDILIKEPKTSIEGQLGASAAQALEHLKANIDMLVDTA